MTRPWSVRDGKWRSGIPVLGRCAEWTPAKNQQTKSFPKCFPELFYWETLLGCFALNI
jgi:hypothetical protein